MLNFLKKYFTYILIILFFVLFSFFYGGEYRDYYQKNQNNVENEKIVEKSIKEFELNSIKEIKDIDFYYTPYKQLLNELVGFIDKAENRVYIEVYMFTETRLKEALVRAKKRGLEVKVLLEKNPYKAGGINNKHYNFLKQAGIDVHWSDTQSFSLNHAKFLIIDDLVILSTGNLTYSTFAFNRDFFIFLNNINYLNIFLKIFDADFNHMQVNIYDQNLVLSPNYSRDKFEKLFLEAQKSIDMYFQYFKDEELEKILIKKAQEGVKIRAIISESSYNSDIEKINFLKNNQIEIVYLNNVKQHAKAILIDGKYLYIGSVNFSNYSLDKNRELGLILKEKSVISKIQKIFKNDFIR